MIVLNQPKTSQTKTISIKQKYIRKHNYYHIDRNRYRAYVNRHLWNLIVQKEQGVGWPFKNALNLNLKNGSSSKILKKTLNPSNIERKRNNLLKKHMGYQSYLEQNNTTCARSLAKQRQIINQQSGIKEKEEGGSSKSLYEELCCAICLEVLVLPHLTTCGHIYCYSCLDESMIFTKTCAICRNSLRAIESIPCQIISNLIIKKFQTIFSQQLQKISYLQRLYDAKKWLKLRLLDQSSYTTPAVDSFLQKQQQRFKDGACTMQIHQKKIKRNERIDVRDTENIWCEGIIKEIYLDSCTGKPCELLIHYNHWHALYNQIIHIQSDRLAKHGFFTKRTDIPRYSLPLLAENMRGTIAVGVVQENARREEIRESRNNRQDNNVINLEVHGLIDQIRHHLQNQANQQRAAERRRQDLRRYEESSRELSNSRTIILQERQIQRLSSVERLTERQRDRQRSYRVSSQEQQRVQDQSERYYLNEENQEHSQWSAESSYSRESIRRVYRTISPRLNSGFQPQNFSQQLQSDSYSSEQSHNFSNNENEQGEHARRNNYEEESREVEELISSSSNQQVIRGHNKVVKHQEQNVFEEGESVVQASNRSDNSEAVFTFTIGFGSSDLILDEESVSSEVRE